MNIAVRYHSRSGNTKKVAEAIAKAVGVEAKDCSVPVTEPVEVLFLGGALYGFGIDEVLREYINRLEPSKVKCVAAFGTSAVVKEPDKTIEKLVREKEIPVSQKNFHCRGAFTVMHKGHPNAEDLKKAAAFACSVVDNAR
jgi:flavodoxin